MTYPQHKTYDFAQLLEIKFAEVFANSIFIQDIGETTEVIFIDEDSDGTDIPDVDTTLHGNWDAESSEAAQAVFNLGRIIGNALVTELDGATSVTVRRPILVKNVNTGVYSAQMDYAIGE